MFRAVPVMIKAAAIILKIYCVLSILIAVLALAFFSGAKESDVAGNLVFSMLLLGFPGSLPAYPVALLVSDLFGTHDMAAYNSRLVLLSWWFVFFLFGAAQWSGLLWLARRMKNEIHD